jgi:hypothetical protein
VKKLLIILLVLTSCSITHKNSASRPLHYFACKTWTDRNQDGIYDYYEFENIKSTFSSSEQVLFVGLFSNHPLGSKITFRLYAPDGSLVDEFTQPQLFKGTLLRSEYSVGDLISGKSTGVWEGVWDVDEDVIAVIEVNLTY